MGSGGTAIRHARATSGVKHCALTLCGVSRRVDRDPDVPTRRSEHRQAAATRRARFPPIRSREGRHRHRSRGALTRMSRLGAPTDGKALSAQSTRVAQRQLSEHGRRVGAGLRRAVRHSTLPSLATHAAPTPSSLALKPDYPGDRVFAFGVGLASMVFLAYNGRRSSISPRPSIRRSSTTRRATSRSRAWKLANARDGRGEPLLLSNEWQAMCAISPSSASSAR